MAGCDQIGGKRNRKVIVCMVIGAATLISEPVVGSGKEFVKSACAKLGNGIHQKVENDTTEGGFTDIVIYTLFCGVELRAHGERTLKGYYTRETGYEVKRYWGYLKYTPTPESVKRTSVENGQWQIGTWKTRARGLNNIVVLEKGPEIVNGSWSYCTEDARHLCSDE